jgi:hypothetical protein
MWSHSKTLAMVQRDDRQKSKDGSQTDTGTQADARITIAIAAVIVIAFAGVYYLAHRRQATRYDAFAKCLSGKQVKMYGLYWCVHCAEQKEMFGASFQHVTYIECGIKGSKEEEAVCMQAGVKNFPTWQFPDGSRKEGAQPLQVLSDKSACTLP